MTNNLERTVLAAIWKKPMWRANIFKQLDDSDFINLHNRDLFMAFKKLHSQNKTITVDSVKFIMKNKFAYPILSSVMCVSPMRYCVVDDAIKDMKDKENLILPYSEQESENICVFRPGVEYYDSNKDIRDSLQIGTLFSIYGLLTGYSWISDSISGFKPGDLIGIVGESGSGRSTLLYSFASQVIKQTEHIILFDPNIDNKKVTQFEIIGNPSIAGARGFRYEAAAIEKDFNKLTLGRQTVMFIDALDKISFREKDVPLSTRDTLAFLKNLAVKHKMAIIVIDNISKKDDYIDFCDVVMATKLDASTKSNEVSFIKNNFGCLESNVMPFDELSGMYAPNDVLTKRVFLEKF